jgi:hypothetical protein
MWKSSSMSWRSVIGGKFCRWRSTVVCTWNEIKETNDGLSPSRIDAVASEISCTPKVIEYFNHVPLFSPLKDSRFYRFLGHTPFSHPCLVVLWVHRSSGMMTFPGPWSKRNGQPVSGPSRRSPVSGAGNGDVARKRVGVVLFNRVFLTS